LPFATGVAAGAFPGLAEDALNLAEDRAIWARYGL